MVQTWEAETRFERFEQGEVGVKVRALDAMNAVVGVHDGHDLVGVRRVAAYECWAEK
jgi:hypothetical protein